MLQVTTLILTNGHNDIPSPQSLSTSQTSPSISNRKEDPRAYPPPLASDPSKSPLTSHPSDSNRSSYDLRPPSSSASKPGRYVYALSPLEVPRKSKRTRWKRDVSFTWDRIPSEETFPVGVSGSGLSGDASFRLVSILLTFAAYHAAASDEGDPPKGSHAGEPGPIHFPPTYSHGARDVHPSFGFQRKRSYNLTRPEGHSLFSDLAEEFPYSYEYNVKDDYEGAHFGHKESGEGSNTNGQYFVRLPDGRVQTVTYYTDKEGFHSDVAYAGNVTPPSGGRYKAPPAVYRGREVARSIASPASLAASTYKAPDVVRPEAPPTLPVSPYQGPGLKIPYLPDPTFAKGLRGPAAPGKTLVSIPAGPPPYVPSIPGLALYASAGPYGRPPPVNYLLGTSGYQSSEVESFDPDSIYTEPSSSEESGESSEEVTPPRGSSAGYGSATSPNRGVAERLTASGLTLEITNPHTNKTIIINLDDLDKPVNPTKLKDKSGAHHHHEVDVPVPGFDISGTLFRNAVDGEDFKGKPMKG